MTITSLPSPSGSKITGAVVGSGDELDILSGGIGSGTTITDGGLETIASGGTETGSMVLGGEQDVLGGTTTAASIGANGNVVVTAGKSQNATIKSGGLQTVSGTGTATGTIIQDGGEQDVSAGGIVQATTIQSGGIEYVYSKGSSVNASVLGGGNEYVETGGSTSGATVHAGGTETVYAGGSAPNTTVDGGVLSLATLDQATGTIAFTGPGGIVQVRNASTSAGASLSGFVAGDRIDLLGVAYGRSYTVMVAGNVATVSAGSQKYAFTLDAASTRALTLQNDNGALGLTGVSLACFLAGTRIRTVHGDVAVEDLVEGDTVETVSGELRPIVWIGHRHIDFRRHAEPSAVLPYRIVAHAFADGQPAAEIFLSPDHAVFVDGVLIPVARLANGDTVRQVRRARGSYLHIELDRHDVILAEGLPVESYFDTGNRNAFGGRSPTQLFPIFGQCDGSNSAHWEARGCAPLVVAGALVEAVRDRLADRAKQLGGARARRVAVA